MSKEIQPHRRNAFAIGFFLFIFYAGRGSVDKIISPFGLIQFARPEVLLLAAWVLWAYFGWRYWQYSRGRAKLILEVKNSKFSGRFTKDDLIRKYFPEEYEKFNNATNPEVELKVRWLGGDDGWKLRLLRTDTQGTGGGTRLSGIGCPRG